jgi:hypothetical protein
LRLICAGSGKYSQEALQRLRQAILARDSGFTDESKGGFTVFGLVVLPVSRPDSATSQFTQAAAGKGPDVVAGQKSQPASGRIAEVA